MNARQESPVELAYPIFVLYSNQTQLKTDRRELVEPDNLVNLDFE